LIVDEEAQPVPLFYAKGLFPEIYYAFNKRKRLYLGSNDVSTEES
jgi:hypothetical protein